MTFDLPPSICEALKGLPVVYGPKEPPKASAKTRAHIAQHFPCTMRQYAQRHGKTIKQANVKFQWWREREYIRRTPNSKYWESML